MLLLVWADACENIAVFSIRLQVTLAYYAKDLGGKVKFCFSCMDERT